MVASPIQGKTPFEMNVTNVRTAGATGTIAPDSSLTLVGYGIGWASAWIGLGWVMAVSGILVLTACLATGQSPVQTVWDFEIYAPLHPNPQVRRAQFNELNGAIEAGKGRLTLEGGADQVLGDIEAKWIPGSIPRGSEGGLHQAPFVRGVIFYDPAIKGNLKDKDHYQVEFRLFVSGKRDDRSGVWRATKKYLADMGFVDGYAYETKDFERLMGSMPGGKIHAMVEEQARKRLMNVAADPVIKDPAPIISVYVRSEGTTPVIAIPNMPSGEAARMPPDTRAVLLPAQSAGEGEQPAPDMTTKGKNFARYEVILHAVSDINASQSTTDLNWWGGLGDGALLEARMGALLSVRCTSEQAKKIARQPEVAQIRMPRGPVVALSMNSNPPKTQAVPRGQTANSPLVVIHHDFQGWREMVGKTLPAGTVLVDLTRERNPGLLPDPYPTPPGGIGPGAKLAEACGGRDGTAPILIRIDPKSPAMIRRLALALAGERYPNELLLVRQGEAREEISRLTGQVVRAEEARDAAEANTEGDSAEQLALRKKAREAIEDLNRRINLLSRLDQEVVFFQADLLALAKVGVVVSGISWLEGHPQGALGGVSRLIEESLQGRLIWIQVIAETRSQVWAGALIDRDDNGFAELRSGVTPHDAEFIPLVWKRPGEKENKGGKFRLTVQHHEAHHPELVRTRPEMFRSPLNKLRPVVVYQDANARPGDPWVIVGQGDGLALKIQQDASGASWEQQVDVVMDKAGRYAVRLEADPAPDVVPRELASMPASRRRHTASVRMLLASLEESGTPQWASASGWLPERPEWVAMPGLAGGCVTVGPSPATRVSDLMLGLPCKPEIGIEGDLPIRSDSEKLFNKAGKTAAEALLWWGRGQSIDQTRARFRRIALGPGY